jgi:hypothetical protein
MLPFSVRVPSRTRQVRSRPISLGLELNGLQSYIFLRFLTADQQLRTPFLLTCTLNSRAMGFPFPEYERKSPDTSQLCCSVPLRRAVTSGIFRRRELNLSDTTSSYFIHRLTTVSVVCTLMLVRLHQTRGWRWSTSIKGSVDRLKGIEFSTVQLILTAV